MADKVLFFTAGPVPTEAEADQIEDLNQSYESKGQVFVRSALGSNAYGYGVEECTHVAGTIPEAYSEVEVIPTDPPVQFLRTGPDRKMVVNGDNELMAVTGALTGSYFVSFEIEDGQIVGINLVAE